MDIFRKKPDSGPSVSDRLDTLREQRIGAGNAVMRCKEAIRSFEHYRDNPPVPSRVPVNSTTSGQIFQLSKAELGLLKLPDIDSRKQAVLKKMEGQAAESAEMANESAREQYEERKREYEARRPGFSDELLVLQDALAKSEKVYVDIQAEIDRLMGRA